jgi:hypothetical protein
MEIPYTDLIQNAIKAPSGHNTQPWKFEIGDSSITIYPDYGRSLPVVDADNHALFISLGCALENLAIAAAHFGFDTKTIINTQPANKEHIIVQLTRSSAKREDLLYQFIGIRQSTRNIYNGNPISVEDIKKLKQVSLQEDVNAILLTDKASHQPIIELVKEASTLQFRNPAFVCELIRWIRFNKKAAIQNGNGLFAGATGNPSVPAWFGKWFMKFSVDADKEANKAADLISSSSALMVFIGRRNDIRAWINVGRSFERTMLTATSLNIHHAHVNMPCEELKVRKKMIDYLHLPDGEQPLLLIRLGYSKKMPYSFRRQVEEVIVK